MQLVAKRTTTTKKYENTKFQQKGASQYYLEKMLERTIEPMIASPESRFQEPLY